MKLKAVETGIIRVGRVELRVQLLNNGQRVIGMSAAEFKAALESVTEQDAGELGKAMAEFFNGSNEAFERYQEETDESRIAIERLRKGARLLEKSHPEYAAMALEFADNLGGFVFWYECAIAEVLPCPSETPSELYETALVAAKASAEFRALREKRVHVLDSAREFLDLANLYLKGGASLARLRLALEVFLTSFENAIQDPKAPEALN